MHATSAAAAAVAALGVIAALALGRPLVAAVLAALAIPLTVTLFVAGRRAPAQVRTDHLVEVYQVNSAPGEEEIERFMYAQCGEEGCEFLEFGEPGAPDEEADLRSRVAVHTTKQSPVIQIYV